MQPSLAVSPHCSPSLCVWPGILRDSGQGNRTPCKIPTTYIWGGAGRAIRAPKLTSSSPFELGFDENPKVQAGLVCAAQHVSTLSGISAHLYTPAIPRIYFPYKNRFGLLLPPARPPYHPPRLNPLAMPCLIVRSLHNSNVLLLITQHTTNIGSLTIPPSKPGLFFSIFLNISS